MSEITQWWHGMPPVTRWLFGLSAATTILTHFGVFDPYRLLFSLEPIYREFQVRKAKGSIFRSRSLLTPCFLNVWS